LILTLNSHIEAKWFVANIKVNGVSPASAKRGVHPINPRQREKPGSGRAFLDGRVCKKPQTPA